MVQTTQHLNPAIKGTIANLDNLDQIPEPYHHLLGYTRGASMDGVELATELLEELREICIELREKQS